MTIRDLTNTLSQIRKDYIAAYQQAEERKEAGMKKLSSDYVPHTQTYEEKLKEINLKYDVDVVKAQRTAAEKGADEINVLRKQEMNGIGRIDSDTMQKINALRGIPVTAVELQAVIDQYGSSNYWVQRAVATIAEESGISTADLKIDAPIDTKLNVLSQLQDQLDHMISDYDANSNTPEARNARLLWLSDDVLERAGKIFDNNMSDVSDGDAVTMSYARISATTGQMQKAIAISNALRNLRGKDARNDLLFKLAEDTNITDTTFAVAGVSDEIREWKTGKAQFYSEAVHLGDSLRLKTDQEDIRQYITGYQTRLNESGRPDNPFWESTLKTVARENSAVADYLLNESGIPITDAEATE